MALPSALEHANHEVMALEQSLKAMQPLWKNLRAPLLVVQGMEDRLVDPRHADFAEGVKTARVVNVNRVAGAGHLLHLDDGESTNALIFRFLSDYADLH